MKPFQPRIPFVSAASLLCVLAGAASAQTRLYFSEYQFQAARISAMGLDGSNPHLLFAPAPSDWSMPCSCWSSC